MRSSIEGDFFDVNNYLSRYVLQGIHPWKSPSSVHDRMGIRLLKSHMVVRWALTVKNIINTIYSVFSKKIYYILTIAFLCIRIVPSQIKTLKTPCTAKWRAHEG